VTKGLIQWTSFDISRLVQDWLDGRLVNNGVILRGPIPP